MADLGLLLRFDFQGHELVRSRPCPGLRDAELIRAAWERASLVEPILEISFPRGSSEISHVFLAAVTASLDENLGKIIRQTYNDLNSDIRHDNEEVFLASFFDVIGGQTGLSPWSMITGLKEFVERSLQRGLFFDDVHEDQLLIAVAHSEHRIDFPLTAVVRVTDPPTPACYVDVVDRSWVLNPPDSLFRVQTWVEPSGA